MAAINSQKYPSQRDVLESVGFREAVIPNSHLSITDRPTVQDALMDHDEALCRLNENVDALFDRLQPIMLQIPPTVSDGATKAITIERSAVAERISGNTAAIRRIAAQLHLLLSRIDL